MPAIDLEAVLDQLTLSEQILLLAGKDFWHTEPVERLGIGSVHVSDGPVGVRGARTVGTTSVSFPCGTAIGATFDPAAAAELAGALADECIDKGVHVLLGPTINLQRHPLGGRHFECYSEDPVLTADLAVAYVTALQARGVAATVKHFVANDTEYDRHRISSEVDDDVLRLAYLVPFEAAVKEAGSWALMSSYNKVNGTYAAENELLLTAVLRDEWGFDGLVMSDWFGTQSTAPSAIAGLDLEMPGPPVHYGEKLEQAVADGLVPEATIRERARRVLQLAERTGMLEDGGSEQRARTSVAERRAVSRRLAAQSFVLLRNEAIGEGEAARRCLPLTLGKGDLLAVIGPNAATTATQGGGSAQVHPEHIVSILEGLRAGYGESGVEVASEIGCVTFEDTPALDAPTRLEYSSEMGGEILHTESHPRFPLVWLGDPVPGVAALVHGNFGVKCTTEYTASVDGPHEVTLAQAGTARVLVDGDLVLEGSPERGKRFFGFGSEDAVGSVDLAAGKTYEIVTEYRVTAGTPVAGLFLGLRPPLRSDDDLIAAAAALAGRATAVICVVGTTAEWETEGHDRADMDLPGRQDDLVRAVTAANPNTVVVVNTGSPVTMDWAQEPSALIQAWFGGDVMGHALADVITGAAEPGGRLPHTIPVKLEDTPAFAYYPGPQGEAPYGEGELIGYRHYATNGLRPRFWFGHGLGYTSFRLSDSKLVSPAAGAGLAVAVKVENTGKRAGHEVVQVYLAPVEHAAGVPRVVYAGSAKVAVEPGSTEHVTVSVADSRLRQLRPGSYTVAVGKSSDPTGHLTAGEVTLA